MKFIDPGFKGNNPGHYSTAVVSNGMLYVSGLLSMDPDTREVCTGDIQAHAAQALQNLDRVLKPYRSRIGTLCINAAYPPRGVPQSAPVMD